MARDWHYTNKLSLSSALLLSFSGMCFVLLFLSCFSFHALVGALKVVFLRSFPVQQTTYRTGN